VIAWHYTQLFTCCKRNIRNIVVGVSLAPCVVQAYSGVALQCAAASLHVSSSFSTRRSAEARRFSAHSAAGTAVRFFIIQMHCPDCSFMVVQMRVMSVTCICHSNSALTCGAPLTAHLLRVRVDHLGGMAIRAHCDGVHPPGVQTHGCPAHERMGAVALRLDPSLPGSCGE